MRQMIATYVLPVEPAREHDLDTMLAAIATDPKANVHIPFARLARLHFASLTLFPRDAGGYGPVLVFENNLDGPLSAYLEDLLREAGPGVHRLLGHTLGYPDAAEADRATILAHLQAHLQPPHAWHIGNPGRTVGRIRKEAALRDALEARLDALTTGPGGAGDAPAIRAALRRVVDDDPDSWSWIRHLPPRLSWRDLVAPRIQLYASAVLAAAIAIVLLPITLAGLAFLRVLELTDKTWQGQPSHAHLRDLGAGEDLAAIQNHMSSIAIVKDGPFRRFVLRLALWLINLVARTSTGGTLGGIPSIHYAHWSQVDGGRRLLFLSNFDGSWENYLDDFIDRASSGLSAIWSNTYEFPRTRFLVLGGARDGHDFKAVARAYQTRTNVWYSAYPDLTVQQIDRNSTISEGMFLDHEPAAELDWLRNF